jgi:protein-S-isoprenylcysteine O-methyltransferase Ste14
MTSNAAAARAVRDRGARVPPIPPPLYYGAAFAAGMLLRAAIGPLAIGARPATAVSGGATLAAGAVLCLAAITAVLRHRTTIVPHHPVTTLITTGAYRLSRNPMYAGLALAYLGATLLAGTWWPLTTLPVALVATQNLVIGPEERYLTEHFGPTYVDYQSRVRRWL